MAARAGPARRPAPLVLAALLAAVALTPRPGAALASTPGNAPGAASGVSADSAAALPALASAAMAETPVAAVPGATAFTVRRVVNPRFRPALPGGPAIAPAAVGTLRALDHYRGHVVAIGRGGPGEQLLWELAAGETGRGNRAVELGAVGARRRGREELRTLTLSLSRGALAAELGDPDAVTASRDASFRQLRGAVLRYEARDAPRALALVGVSRPVPGVPATRLALGGAAVEALPYEGAQLSATLFAATRARPPAPLLPAAGDTLPGQGVFGSFGWRAPAGASRFSQEIGVQAHDLEGSRTVGLQHRLEWSLQTRTLLMAVGEERASAHARTLGTDRLGWAPSREDRWSLQNRFAKGRAEAHLTGLVREGGDSTLAARTLQLGASAALGHSAWYGGADAVWDQRRALGLDERRLALYAGGAFRSGHALLARIERADRPGRAGDLTALSEASIALPHALRLTLEPRATWNADAFGQADLTTRLSVPSAWLSSRVTASLVLGADRARGFRHGVREGSIAFSFAPNPRDRGDLEIRRLDTGGLPQIESSASYEARRERYGLPGGRLRSPSDTARVTVRVVRNGNGTGVADVLVSLDGRDLRFTDADGQAEFENVPPGIHVIAVEERSLPEGWEVLATSRVFLTVERGRIMDPVEFRIARPERRTKF